MLLDVAAAERALALARQYTKEREAFGRPLIHLPPVRMSRPRPEPLGGYGHVKAGTDCGTGR